MLRTWTTSVSTSSSATHSPSSKPWLGEVRSITCKSQSCASRASSATLSSSQQVLVHDAANYTKGRGLQVARRLLGQGLLTSENPLHKEQRRLLQPIFQPRRLQRFDTTFQQTRERLQHWPTVISANSEMTRLTLEIISELSSAARWTPTKCARLWRKPRAPFVHGCRSTKS